MARLKGRRVRRVVLGISGSIAAYKSCEVVRGLTRAGAQVKVVLTPTAARFVTALTLSVLSRGPVAQDAFDPGLWDMAHLSWASWADLILVAPATADLLSRLARGGAGGLLESMILSARCPVALAPAMDAEMWAHPATRANIAAVKTFGYRIWGPVKGELASGKVAMGRLMDPQDLVRRALG